MGIVQQAYPYTCSDPGDLLLHTVVALVAEKAAVHCTSHTKPVDAHSKVEGNMESFGAWLQLVGSAKHWRFGSRARKRAAAWDALL